MDSPPPTSARPSRRARATSPRLLRARTAFHVITWLLLLVWPMSFVGVGLFWAIGAPRRNVTVSEAPPRGPVIARGWIENDQRHESPTGWYAAAWSAHAGGPMIGSGTADCDVAGLDGLTLADTRGSLRIDPAFLTRRGSESEITIDPVFLFAASEAPPPAVTDRCKKQLSKGTFGGPKGTFQGYREIVLPRGTIVEVSGCRKDDAIIPCDDGADGIFIPPRDALSGAHAQRRHDRAVVLEALQTTGAFLLVLSGLWLWLGHRAVVLGGPRSERTTREDAC